MRIDDFWRREFISMNLSADDKNQAIADLLNLLVSRHELTDSDAVLREILHREDTVPTHLLPNIAFPHLRTTNVHRRRVMVAKLAAPIEWNGPGGESVSMIFLSLVPESDGDSLFEILQTLCSQLSSEVVRENLLKTQTVDELCEMLSGIGSNFSVDGLTLTRMLRGGHTDVIHRLAWSPCGSRIVSAGPSADGVCAWDVETGQLKARMRDHEGPVYSVAWSPAGDTIATACQDGVLRFWDAADFSLRDRIDTRAELYDVAWSPDGSRIACAGHFFMVRVWRIDEMQTIPIEGGLNIAYSVRWSPDGTLLAAGGARMDPCLRVWDAATGKLLKRFPIDGSVFAVAWSPDSEVVIAGTENGRLFFFDTKTWRSPDSVSLHLGQLTALSFSSDSQYFASKADDGCVRIVRTRNREQVAVLPDTGVSHRLFNGLAFHPQSLTLATLGDDGAAVRIWNLDRAVLERNETPPQPAVPVVDRSGVYPDKTLREKAEVGEFDVFLCYNSTDQHNVMDIGRRLQDRGIMPWLDEWQVQPGQSWLQQLSLRLDRVKSAAVFIGPAGVGPWQEKEIEALLSKMVRDGIHLIPVILEGTTAIPELPLFMQSLRLVDFRRDESDPMKMLIWGITGRTP